MSDTVSKAQKAKNASYELFKIPTETKNKALSAVAELLNESRHLIIQENQKDCELWGKDIGDALLKRLKISEAKMDSIIEGVKSVYSLDDPVGKTMSSTELDRGLELYQVRTPIGVIGFVFESRPDALVQISTLCLKSSNSVILKGGKEASNTNRLLYDIIQKASEEAGIPEGWIQLVESRQEVDELLKLDNVIDLMIPRGSNSFVKYVKDNTKIPVLGHASGICHVYVDEYADLHKAVDIAYDSKVQYPAVCNAVETLLVHESVADTFLKKIWPLLKSQGVTARGCERTLKVLPSLEKASEEDWSKEYNDLELDIKIVSTIKEAADHINKYGSHHTDAIVTEDENSKRFFIESVDSSSVMVNASTRFSDGYRYGLGSEVGISTNKVHARGPVGLEGLTTYKWVLLGGGHKVADYDVKKFTHKRLNKDFKLNS